MWKRSLITIHVEVLVSIFHGEKETTLIYYILKRCTVLPLSQNN
jgi:hypothetical protein